VSLESLRSRVKRLELFKSPVALLMEPDGFGLETATPVQQAVMWTLGKRDIPDELWADEAVQRVFGGARPCAGSLEEVLLLSGVRGGKTFIAACAAFWMSQTVRLDTGSGMYMRPGEMPRVSIVSARLDQAQAAFRYLKGALTKQGPLNDVLVGDPLADSLVVRHPTGVPIEICVVATASAGTSLVARWCAGVIFDEAPRMASEGEGAVLSLEGMVEGVQSRMLDNALIMYIGSPVGPVGKVYKLFQSFFGKTDVVCAIRARGPDMNPYYWTPERCEKLKRNPDVYRTDVEALFRDLETAMYSSTSVEAAMRDEPKVVPYEEGRTYSASMDPGTRGNAWTLLIADTTDNLKTRVSLAMQWIGSQAEPLSPWDVLTEMKKILLEYRVVTVKTDQFAVDFIRDIAFKIGFGIEHIPFTGKNRMGMYESVRLKLDAGYLELPRDDALRQDLLTVKKRVTTGDPKPILVETADGRHCDYAPALALLCGTYIAESELVQETIVPVEVRMAAETEHQELAWWETEPERFGNDGVDEVTDWM